MSEKALRLNVRREYFDGAVARTKKLEYRLVNKYWISRLVGKEFSKIIYCLGYPKKGDVSRMIFRPWRGFHVTTITHKEFGDKPVKVFAITINR